MAWVLKKTIKRSAKQINKPTHNWGKQSRLALIHAIACPQQRTIHPRGHTCFRAVVDMPCSGLACQDLLLGVFGSEVLLGVYHSSVQSKRSTLPRRVRCCGGRSECEGVREQLLSTLAAGLLGTGSNICQGW